MKLPKVGPNDGNRMTQSGGGEGSGTTSSVKPKVAALSIEKAKSAAKQASASASAATTPVKTSRENPGVLDTVKLDTEKLLRDAKRDEKRAARKVGDERFQRSIDRSTGARVKLNPNEL